MRAFRHLFPVLASAVLAVHSASACHCPEGLLGHAGEAFSEDTLCHASLETRHGESQHGEFPQCADCGDYESAPAPPVVKAVASVHLPECDPATAIAGHPSVSLRPQTVRNAGPPPPAVPRAALTPVLLKQRLLN
ncbi:MAG: hypothetical protein OXF66_08725 [Gammaproteobacteria bacterium]|nr:hypothetical protein [Gammaproteobacteria bacterium]